MLVQKERFAGKGTGQGSPPMRAGCPRFAQAPQSRAPLRGRPQGLAPPHPRAWPGHRPHGKGPLASASATGGACRVRGRPDRPATPTDRARSSSPPSHRADRPAHRHAAAAAAAPPTRAPGFDRRPNAAPCAATRRGRRRRPCDSAGSYGEAPGSLPGRCARPGDGGVSASSLAPWQFRIMYIM
jgi:hypothetical protein